MFAFILMVCFLFIVMYFYMYNHKVRQLTKTVLKRTNSYYIYGDVLFLHRQTVLYITHSYLRFSTF